MITDIQKSYGIDEDTNIEEICAKVCRVLGFGANECADIFVYRISKAESGAGTIIDGTPNGAGAGIFQFDKIPFYDNQSRYKTKHIEKVKYQLSIDVSETTWEELKIDILKGALACRLHFKPFKEEIPADMVGQGRYWKRHYNTEAGAGTVKHFLEMNGFDMEEYHVSMEVEF
ncbi:MAG: hypothetical protein KAQ94_06030 [Arcobacteraceae bacterium]|nr:hypothetical protein [Arcobacteraceae bacterium]